MKYFYSLFGLAIASELEFANLIPAATTENPDYTIILGKTPDKIDGTQCGISAYATPREFLFEVKNIARFYCANKLIIVDKHPHADNQDIKVFLLRTVFTYLLNQQQYLVLSGTALLVQDKALIIASTASNGKSSLGYSLSKIYNYPIISDGLLVLKEHGWPFTVIPDSIRDPDFEIPKHQNTAKKTISIVPNLTPVTLWQNCCDALGVEYANLTKVRQNMLKYEIPTTVEFPQSLEVANIINLKIHTQAEPLITEITSTSKIDTILNLASMTPLVTQTQNTKANFVHSVKLANQTRVLEIIRPRKYSYQEFAKFVADNLLPTTSLQNDISTTGKMA